MFKFGKKKKEVSHDTSLYAPLQGEIIELEKVADPVFSSKMMGEGYAVEPTDETIVSPVAGTVIMVQGHAVGIKRFDGLEVLIHLGIDTVSLNGKPFKLKVKEGDILNGGDVIGKADWSQVKAANLPKTTMILITNSADLLDMEKFSVIYKNARVAENIGNAVTK
ncbi:MAG: PTS glucose transporter subunit IIA [Streptococcaceae bacterium]|nr:PTS glucose transporter subunit IIA [Streptococcaceae bacterium]